MAGDLGGSPKSPQYGLLKRGRLEEKEEKKLRKCPKVYFQHRCCPCLTVMLIQNLMVWDESVCGATAACTLDAVARPSGSCCLLHSDNSLAQDSQPASGWWRSCDVRPALLSHDRCWRARAWGRGRTL